MKSMPLSIEPTRILETVDAFCCDYSWVGEKEDVTFKE